MKLKNIIIAGSLLFAFCVANTSCEDMLTVDTGDKSYTNANDTLYSYWGILKHVQDVAERQVILNELRGDLLSPTEYITDTLHAIANFDDPADGSCSLLDISDYYAIINNCNLYIANADTNKVKSNKKYMLPEYAQVQAIRAWTYLQLVQFYGEVPFISEPISNLSVINNFDYNANLVNKDNLVDKLVALGLPRYADTSYPVYKEYNNGAIRLSARLCFIPVRLVLGDLYLLRGRDASDYRQAAQYYYDYLRANSAYLSDDYCTATKNRNVSALNSNEYRYTSTGWGGFASQYTWSSTGEVISYIPSSANKQFGTMLMRVADIFGYTPTSSQATTTSTNDDGEEESSSSGAISVAPNYKAQVLPSAEYSALSKAQTYIHWNTQTMEAEDYGTCGDARIHYATQELTFNSSSLANSLTLTLACKAARSTSFYYTVPIYRKTVVWLRLAEAINRAGFPEHAFAILKDGLNDFNYPEPGQERTVITQHLDDEGNPLLDDNGDPIPNDTTIEVYTRYNSYGAMHYVSDEEVNSFFLDFKEETWDDNYGIHARGCGFGNWASVTKTVSPITNITGYYDSEYFDYEPRLAAEGVDVYTASKDEVINAVENIICDELALEASFEGYRFNDLVRMALHKNASGFDGTRWLAAKVADRAKQEASLDGKQAAVSRDEALYSKLQNPKLWYFSKPAWTGNK